MIKRYKIFVLTLFLGLGYSADSQDPVFSHFYANGLHLNPAMAGVEGPIRVFIGYRNQWPNSGSSYITYHASYDQYVEKLHGGIGVRVMNDRQGLGTFNSYNLDLMYSYQFQAGRDLYFSGGLQAGVGQRSFDPSTLVFGDMLNAVTGIVSSGYETINAYSELYPDFAAGGAAFYKNIYGGFSVHHLLNPVVTSKTDPTGRIPRTYTAHLGAFIPIIEKRLGKEVLQLSPNMVFIQQQRVQQINYGLELIYKDVLLGIWTRHDLLLSYGNLVFSAGYGFNNIRFRYSYDVKLSSPTIRLPNMGAHEFSLLIITENLSIRNKHRAIKCPKI